MIHATLPPTHYVHEHFQKTGYASWYGEQFQGKPTASGEPFDMYAMTAASPNLPLYSRVEVTNLENGQSDIVTVNDRGPYHSGRIIDLSYVAARKIGLIGRETARVRIRVVSTPAR
ncbi:MAG TPA: septal ring lytic transglycosylase RlpA family protein [Nevskiaceae bacterium]|nr:septal ring lytic transglycosylase RlpA family protein [Nevskiaceae bacterium]